MVSDVAARYGLTGTAPPTSRGEWGETTTTARDLARFLSPAARRRPSGRRRRPAGLDAHRHPGGRRRVRPAVRPVRHRTAPVGGQTGMDAASAESGTCTRSRHGRPRGGAAQRGARYVGYAEPGRRSTRRGRLPPTLTSSRTGRLRRRSGLGDGGGGEAGEPDPLVDAGHVVVPAARKTMSAVSFARDTRAEVCRPAEAALAQARQRSHPHDLADHGSRCRPAGRSPPRRAPRSPPPPSSPCAPRGDPLAQRGGAAWPRRGVQRHVGDVAGPHGWAKAVATLVVRGAPGRRHPRGRAHTTGE